MEQALARALQHTTELGYRASLSLLSQRAGKQERRWDLRLADGSRGVLRRPEPSDAVALACFLNRSPQGPVDSPVAVDLRPRAFEDDRQELPDPCVPVVEAVKEILWQAAAAGEDAFVLSARDQVLGIARVEREPEVCEPPLDALWLAQHGLEPSEVCISRMALASEMRGQGLSHALKRAQVAAAGDAGYRALVSPWGNSISQAIARRAGGLVQTASMSGWVLIPTQGQNLKSQEVSAAGLCR